MRVNSQSEMNRMTNLSRQLTLDLSNDIVLQEIDDKECRSPLPLTVYYSEQVDLFMAHQQTSDTRLFMLHILKSKAQMIAEFRRMCNDNQATLDKIDVFKNTYNSNTAV
ncbi:unnamed protein product [Rotaria sp. Silwood2]|nr:unnamed protein product [Rotaria sp. Silwood2]